MFDLKNQHIRTQNQDDDFDFWISNQQVDDHSSSYNVSSYSEEHHFNDYSPPLWKTPYGVETSPLLQRYRHSCDQISRQVCSQAIAEGRKELMEMIRNMPESTYELSLKDLVDEKQEVKQEEVARDQETSFHFCSNNSQSKKPTRKKRESIRKPVQMARSGSMEKETFLIKLFIPSFGRKTKVKPEKPSRLCSSLSFDESNKQEGWLRRLLISGTGKDSRSSSNNSSSSSNNDNSTIRLCRHGKSPGCWSFICSNKSKGSEYIY